MSAVKFRIRTKSFSLQLQQILCGGKYNRLVEDNENGLAENNKNQWLIPKTVNHHENPKLFLLYLNVHCAKVIIKHCVYLIHNQLLLQEGMGYKCMKNMSIHG